MKKLQYLLSLIFIILIFNGAFAQMSGTYSIGFGADDDYYTLFQAKNDLVANGASGPVIFELSADYVSTSDTYPIYLYAFSGASETNTLTIKPAEGTSHVIERDLMSPGSAIFALVDVSHVIIDGSNNGTDSRDLTISSLGDDTETAAVALFTNSTPGSNIVIKNCILKAGSKSYETTGIYSDYFTDVVFENNQINNARIGIITFGDNVSILNNEIGSDTESEYLHYGISTQFGSNITVSGNKIFKLIDDNDFDAVRAISVNDVTGNMIISENYIDSIIHTGNEVVQAISIEDCVPENMLISNNRISNIASDSYTDNYPGAIAINCPSMTSGMHILYNSIYMPENNEYGTGSGGSGVFAGGILVGAGTGIIMKNNIIVNELGKRYGGSNIVMGASVLINDDNSPFAENDNNLFFAAGDYDLVTLAANSSLAVFDLAGWQTWTGGGQHSFFSEPLFISADSLQLQACSDAIAHAVYTSTVTNDIEDLARDSEYPTMGAYEYEKVQAENIGLYPPVKGFGFLEWEKGNGCKTAVFMKRGNFLPERPEPVNGVTYVSSEYFGSGDQIGSSGWFCVYNSEYQNEFIQITGDSDDYTLMACEYYGSEGNEIYLTESTAGNPNVGMLGTSVNELEDHVFLINPNPSSGKITVEIDRQTLSNIDHDLQILDITGKEVYSLPNIKEEKKDIDLSHLPRGVYFVKIRTKDRSFTEKLIIR